MGRVCGRLLPCCVALSYRMVVWVECVIACLLPKTPKPSLTGCDAAEIFSSPLLPPSPCPRSSVCNPAHRTAQLCTAQSRTGPNEPDQNEWRLSQFLPRAPAQKFSKSNREIGPHRQKFLDVPCNAGPCFLCTQRLSVIRQQPNPFPYRYKIYTTVMGWCESS